MKLASIIIAAMVCCSVLADQTNSPRYQIIVATQGNLEPTVFKLDTWTGETWTYFRLDKPLVPTVRHVWVEVEHLKPSGNDKRTLK